MTGRPARGLLKQGEHPDPLDPNQVRPDPRTWSSRQRRASSSVVMRTFREALLLPGEPDVRASVIDDLGTYYNMDADEVVRRCIAWEEWSVEEWRAAQRNSDSPLAQFYQTTMSWSFDLLWYAYLQCEGFAYPVSVAIAHSLPPPRPGTAHLDFGSGVGTTGQLFRRLGYETTIADISTTLLAFARFRLERRSDVVTYLDLSQEALGSARYDVITAIDTMAHVPDVAATARALHRALRPAGLLFANFDVRPPSDENAWHLYSDDLLPRWQLQRAGFEPEESLDGMITRYRRVEPIGIVHQARGLRDTALLRSPLRPAVRAMRRVLEAAWKVDGWR